MDDLTVGTIIKWYDYEYGEDGRIKPYWFIIFGRDSSFSTPRYYHMFKTTSQIHYYEEGGERAGSIHKKLKQSIQTSFEQDCVIDFDFSIVSRHTIDEVHERISSGKIKIMGVIKNIMPELYGLLTKGKGTSLMIMNQIHETYNLDGYSGLNRPKKRSTDYYRKKTSRS